MISALAHETMVTPKSAPAPLATAGRMAPRNEVVMHPQPNDVPPGYCHCGCGQQTKPRPDGQPRTYLRGHNKRRGLPYTVDPATGCWNPTNRARMANGYVRFQYEGREWLAHRWMYTQLIGPIPPDLTIDHLCKNRACVNPAHMEVVTRGENTLRGEGPSARQARQTECIHGHPLTGDNLYIDKRGRRHCIACRDRRTRERTDRRRNTRKP